MSPAIPQAPAKRHVDSGGVVEGRKEEYVTRALLVPLRIYLGVIFLVAAWPKLTAAGGFQGRLEGFLENVAMNNAHAFYRDFIESIILPNAALVTPLVVFGELLVAIALLAGATTRLASGIAMFFLLNYMLAKGMWFWTPASNDAPLFFIGLVVLLGSAGRSLGIDRFLQRRYPTVGLW
jgi:thiosulfate dehydrogenase (quinone) large subunit